MKPSIPRGTRDFGPDEMMKREYIFDTIKSFYRKYGFLPLETPSMENITTLTGKYGDEGDQLIFKILNSRIHESKNKELLQKEFELSLESSRNSAEITEKALRYDLTIPFARYVVMHQNELTFPFKRYQIQPVWRADKPQKGRYREFFQCDADVIGSNSLIYETELIQIFDDVFTALNLPVIIKLNNRKILAGLAESIGQKDKFMSMTIALDKLDKIGIDGVSKEMAEHGFEEKSIELLKEFLSGFAEIKDWENQLTYVKTKLSNSEEGLKGIQELEEVLSNIKNVGLSTAEIEFDLTLARGLNYYTGAIFEVKAKDFEMGSICGGGRYDDLTGIFGLKGMSGVGISFGADRIYDVLEGKNLFPEFKAAGTQILFMNFGTEESKTCQKLIKTLRSAGFNTEIFPEPTPGKMKKQFAFAEGKKIPFAVFIGMDEINAQKAKVKNLKTGEQSEVDFNHLTTYFISIFQ